LPLTKDARLINCYAELDPEDNEYWIYKRLGLSATPIYAPGAGNGQGIYTFGGSGGSTIIFVKNNYVYQNGTIVGSMGASPGGPPLAFFETVNSVPQTVVIQGPTSAWILTPSIPSFAQITDVNFPSDFVPGWATLDGTLYVMDVLGGIWGTLNTNNAAVWSGANVIYASSKADQGVFLTTQLSYVVAMKQWTTQIFYDAGNPPPGSPLSPVPESQIPFGCLHAYTVQKLDDILFWMTSNQTISPQIIQMENLSAKIVSTPAVERILDNVLTDTGSVQGVYSWSLKHGGHRFYGVTFTANNITLVYDIDQQLWYLWTDPNGNFWPIVGMAYQLPSYTIGTGPQPGLHLAQHLSNGNIYQLDGDYEFPNDAGVMFPVDIYTPNYNAGTIRRKMLNMMYFHTDMVSGSTLQSRYTDDDFQTWTNFRTTDLSLPKPFLDSEGTFHNRRAYHFRHQSNTVFRIKSGELQLDIGSL